LLLSDCPASATLVMLGIAAYRVPGRQSWNGSWGKIVAGRNISRWIFRFMSFADLFAPRPSTKALIEFLRRLEISLDAGIDIRKALENESLRSDSVMRWRTIAMSRAVNAGSSLTDAIEATGDYFPKLVRELISVGEKTGHLTEVLKQLVANYEEQLALKRMFWSTISWSLFQLAVALGVIGFLIWISAVIGRTTGSPTDLLGIGLTGEWGLFVYLIFLGLVGTGIFLAYRATITGQLWVAPIQRFVLRLPVLGGALRSLSIARFAWTLHITTTTALDVKQCLLLSLASTHNMEFIDQSPRIERVINRGHPIYEAMMETRLFPSELIHSVQVGEQSGRLDETLAIIARQQLESARTALTLLTRGAGFVIWMLVAGLIIVLIFRLAGVYLGGINQALQAIK
jgi:type IV pilus assembly protein PilC